MEENINPIFRYDWETLYEDIASDKTITYVSDIPSPYGMTIRLYHNTKKDIYIKEYPASGSIHNYINKEEADKIIERSVIQPRILRPLFENEVDINGTGFI